MKRVAGKLAKRPAGVVTVLVVAVLAALPVMTGATRAMAEAPKTSIRPVVREHVYPPALPSFAPARSLRPVPRPRHASRTQTGTDDKKVVTKAAVVTAAPKPTTSNAVRSTSSNAAMLSPRDAAEAGVSRSQSASKKSKDGLQRLCKSRKIIGKQVAPVPGKLSGCGIRKGAIKLYEVNGVKLSTPAVMTCETAVRLNQWVDGGMRNAVKHYGGGVAELKVAAGYSCRTRNSRPGAKISEHGKGNAIDLSAFTLKNGETISVLNDWGKGRKGRILKKMHKNACGPFGTVLGPKADRHHKDHFHFDVAHHRGGSYCR